MRSLLLVGCLLGAGLYACGGTDTSPTGLSNQYGNGGTSSATDGGSVDNGGNNGGGNNGGGNNGGSNGGGDTDSGTGGTDPGTDSGTTGGGSTDAGFCVKAATPSTGHHNPGTNCMTSSCHGPGGNGPTWTIGGTLYADSAGTTPLSGATIVVTDAKGQVLELATATNGNFHTATPVTHPLTVMASKCPSTVAMTAQVKAVQGCNQTSCHNSSMPMHLP